jgi:cation transport protein ChaC
MRGDGYRARWVTADTGEGVLRALTFVANRAGERYAGRLSDQHFAERIASA